MSPSLWIAMAVLVAGCGRIGFESNGDAGLPLCTPAPLTITPGATTPVELCAGVSYYSIELEPGTRVGATLLLDSESLRAASLSLIAPDGIPLAGPVWFSTGLEATGTVTTGGAQLVEISADIPLTAVLTVSALPPAGRVLYISPTGSDAGDGSRAAPWTTWSFALALLQPGDTLIAEDGEWTQSLISIDCGAGEAVSGTPAAPITVLARHQRKAHLRADGTDAIFISRCANWIVDGLHASNRDGGTSGIVLLLKNLTSFVGRNLLLEHPNRCGNNHAVEISGLLTAGVLIEDSEVYDFARSAMLAADGPGIVFRRNYVHSRNAAAISCFPTDGYPDRGDAGFFCYEYDASPSCITENVMAENTATPVTNLDAASWHVYSSLARDSYIGAAVGSDEPVTTPGPVSLVAQFVCVDCDVGYWVRGLNADLRNATLLGGRSRFSTTYGIGAMADPLNGPGGSTTFRNVLVADNERSGFNISGQASTLVAYSNASGSPTLFPGAEDISDMTGDIQRSLSIAPTQVGDTDGSCIVHVPPGSNMKGAGESGADIGANIVYRVVDGVLTDRKLWNQRTGAFPCGAIVPGVNDVAGASCFDAHTRFRVGVAGCPIP